MQYKKGKTGFTVVELLIGLAITAVLLTAVAVAFNASVINYRENERIFQSINHARQALFRMTTQLRTGSAVDPNDPNTECNFFTADGDEIIYEFRSAENKLYLVTVSNGNEYVLCDNVTSMNFTKTFSDDGTYCKNVQISMTVQAGGLQQTLSAAAVIRKNLQL